MKLGANTDSSSHFHPPITLTHSRPVAKRVRTLLLSNWRMPHNIFPLCRCVGKEKNGDCEQMYERLFISDAGLDCTRGRLNNAFAFRDSCFVVWMLYELVYCDLKGFRGRWLSGNGTGIRHVCQGNRRARTGGLHPPPHRHRRQCEGGPVSLTSLITMETETFLPRGLATPVNHEQVTTGTPRCTDGSPEECGSKTRDI